MGPRPAIHEAGGTCLHRCGTWMGQPTGDLHDLWGLVLLFQSLWELPKLSLLQHNTEADLSQNEVSISCNCKRTAAASGVSSPSETHLGLNT